MRIFPALALMLAPALTLASPAPAFGADGSQQAMTRLTQKFEQADTDHDGKLTLAEAKAGMPRLAAHFDEIDTQHQGYLTLDQIKQFVQSRMGG
jgi:hypothetical protein